MSDRFKFRVPFYKHDDTFAGFDFTDFIHGLGAYNAGRVYRGEFEQCTGLKDKTGRLIYEGDILATSNNDPKYDLWKPEDWGYTVVYWNEKNLCFAGTKWFIDGPEEESVFNAEFVEVVGNIHENPELLEAQK